MRWTWWRHGCAVAAVAVGVSWALGAAAAENLDNPTVLTDKPLNGGSSLAGTITPRVGFPAHVYTASKEGLVRVVMTTTSASGGTARRPYLRVLSQSNTERHAEAWSSNGYRNGASATAELVFRVRPGEKFTVIATLGQHLEGGRRVNADYTLTVKE